MRIPTPHPFPGVTESIQKNMSEIQNYNNYYPELDGLRGLAALMVFFSHAMGLVSPTPLITYLQNSPLRTLWDGAAAVDFFFVLSGFVLTLPLVARKMVGFSYVAYAIRRLFRLYPAYWLALGLSIALHSLYSSTGMHQLSEWAQSLWTDPITLSVIARHATLLLKTNTHAIDPVVWSLIVEMRMSLVLPVFVYFLIRSHSAWAQAGLVIVSFLLAAITAKLMYLPHFALGAYLANNIFYFQHVISGLSRPVLIGLLVAAIYLYGNRWTMSYGYDASLQSYLSAGSGLLLIVIATSVNSVGSFLKSNVCIFLGKTSYSFYLFHLPVLLVTTSTLYPISHSLLLCVFTAFLVSYALAILSYRYIEYPAIQFGKILAAKNTVLRKLKPI